MRILLANPRGFCAGVDRAIEIVERCLEEYGPPVYVRHEIVHNRHVVDGLRAKGAVFVEDPAEVPEGSLLVYSAHGVSPAVREAADISADWGVDARVLLSNDWASLNPGYYVVYMGSYPTESAARADCDSVGRSPSGACYGRRISDDPSDR